MNDRCRGATSPITPLARQLRKGVSRKDHVEILGQPGAVERLASVMHGEGVVRGVSRDRPERGVAAPPGQVERLAAGGDQPRARHQGHPRPGERLPPGPPRGPARCASRGRPSSRRRYFRGSAAAGTPLSCTRLRSAPPAFRRACAAPPGTCLPQGISSPTSEHPNCGHEGTSAP